MTEEVAPNITIDVAKERDKPRLVALLFCDYVNQSIEGKNNLLGTFDRITVTRDPGLTEGEPAFSPQIVMFFRLERIQGGVINLTVFSPDNRLVAGAEFTPQQEAEKSDGRGYVQLFGNIAFPVTGPGVYWFDISYRGNSLGGTSLTVLIQPSPEVGNGPGNS